MQSYPKTCLLFGLLWVLFATAPAAAVEQRSPHSMDIRLSANTLSSKKEKRQAKKSLKKSLRRRLEAGSDANLFASALLYLLLALLVKGIGNLFGAGLSYGQALLFTGISLGIMGLAFITLFLLILSKGDVQMC